MLTITFYDGSLLLIMFIATIIILYALYVHFIRPNRKKDPPWPSATYKKQVDDKLKCPDIEEWEKKIAN